MPSKLKKPDIESTIEALPLIRRVGVPFESRDGCILVCDDAADIRETAALLHDGFSVAPTYAALSLKWTARRASRRLGVRVVPLNHVRTRREREVVVVVPRVGGRRAVLRKAVAVARRGRVAYAFSSPVVPTLPRHGDLFEANAERVVETVNGLADEESRLCYLSVLKALMRGDSGFIRISAYPQYRHPAVQAEPGDTVCEGGIGAGANTTRMLSAMVGDGGRIFGFEPVRGQFEAAFARVASAANVTLEHAGLWSEPGEAEIRLAGPASTMTGVAKHLDKPAERCPLVSIDGYFEDKPHRPTMIKLDIEGAEEQALRGGRGIITACRPKLQVCLYHAIDHFLRFPAEYLRMGYRVYIGHHTPFMTETVMYAVPR